MKSAIKIIQREIDQREFANKHDHLRKEEISEELESLYKALKQVKLFHQPIKPLVCDI